MASSRRQPDAEENLAKAAAFPVFEGEDPWTEEEIEEIREELVADIARMERAIEVAEAGLADLFEDGTEGAGRDPADVGSSNFERDQEMSLAQNARDMLEQAQLAYRMFCSGEYGRCEVCGNPIGKDRLQVFPRATMCVTCKQREERR
ncbi:MAG TPA: TraR/DksA C4-type zinc finger protein [Propionicimonas sp.]|nr:TraR/DksA C4-type zinc finger protein [Propionicimonas sp.]